MDPTHEAKPSVLPQQSAFGQSPMDYLIQEVRELRRDTATLQREHDMLCRDSRRRSRQMISFIEYSTAFNASLAQIMGNCSLNAGPFPVQFPPPPMIPQYDSHEDDAKDSDA